MEGKKMITWKDWMRAQPGLHEMHAGEIVERAKKAYAADPTAFLRALNERSLVTAFYLLRREGRKSATAKIPKMGWIDREIEKRERVLAVLRQVRKLLQEHRVGA